MLAQGIQLEPCFESFHCTNPWRGMIYGMTARLNATDNAPIWQIWDTFAIENTTMLGWWEPDCPVQTGSADVVATVYTHWGAPGSAANTSLGRTLIAVANFDNQPHDVTLALNLTALGHAGATASGLTLRAPAIRHFQNASVHALGGGPLLVPASRGFLFLLA
jgi:hypothetical protein